MSTEPLAPIPDFANAPIASPGAMQSAAGEVDSGTSLLMALREFRGLDSVLDEIPDRVYLKDTRNRTIRVNRAVAESLGTTPEAIADTPTELWYPEHAAEYYDADLRVMQTGRAELGIIERIPGTDGVDRVFETTKFPLWREGTSVRGILVIAREVTERETLKEMMSRAERFLTFGQLAGAAAHDLRNLLTALQGNLDIAAQSLPAAHSARVTLGAAADAATLAGDLARELLRSVGTSAMQPQRVNLNTLLSETLRLVRHIVPAGVEMRLHLDRGQPLVLADPAQLSRVLINLVLNACEAMPTGGALTLSSQAVPGTDAGVGATCSFSVADSGAGIPRELRPNLFHSSVTTKGIDGAGFGLVSSHQIVTALGGQIVFDTREGVGTVFRVIFPAWDGA